MTSFSILTLGCKVNSYESEAVINNLINHGYVLKQFNDVCDIYIINTCTVTKTSDQKSRQMIHGARRRNPNAIVVAMGCYAQLNQVEASSIADIVLGTNNKLKVYELVNSFIETKTQINAITDVLNHPSYEEMKISNLKTHTRGFIKIQDGCENYCSYCAIPYSRGKIRSREPQNVIDEINNLVKQGTKEVILAGINTGAYGRDLGSVTLAGLVERIMTETSLYRLRLSSIELMEITDELLNVLKKYEDRVAHHFHVPLQGGSETVLERMHRKYTITEYENRIKDIRALFPNAAITTDILAGFVGETEEEFNETINFIKKIGYYEMHVFPYSRRSGTLADEMPGHLDKQVITSRARKITETAKVMRDEYINSCLGKTYDVLIETCKDGKWKGHTSNYLDVVVESDHIKENEIVKVKLLTNNNGLIFGKEEL